MDINLKDIKLKIMKIDVEKYLSNEEIKEIISDEIKRHVRDVVGNSYFSFVGKLAKNLAKEGVQEMIPNFKELINEQICSEIRNVKLSSFFVHSFGWNNKGNKILNEVLSNNKELLDAKIKEIFKTVANEN